MGFVRRSGRIAKEIRILLIGTDTSGRVFAEETQTVTLSRHGAGIISKHKLAADGILILRFLGGSSEVSIRPVGELGEDLRGYVFGVTFVDPNLDFWELKFPPPPTWRVDFESPLECTTCKTREVVDQSEVEADVYALAEFILRFCSKCGMSTKWLRATGEALAETTAPPSVIRESPRRQAPAALPQPLLNRSRALPVDSAQHSRLGITAIADPEVSPAPVTALASTSDANGASRRRDVRTRVSFSACIRQNGIEELVVCGNVSKGGFSFRSLKSYLAGSDIDVAMPYYPGMEPPFVRATIRHSLVLPNNNFHYGVKYATTNKISKS